MNCLLLVLFFQVQLLLQQFLVLHFLLLELLLHVRVTLHVFFTETIDLEIWVAHLESTVSNCLYCLDLFGHLFINNLFDFPLLSFTDISIFQFISQFVVEFQMHQIAVHVFFEHFGINEILTAQLVNFLLAYEFVLIINHFSMLFFQFLCNVVNVRHPFRSRTKLRNKETSNFRIIQSCQQHSTIVYDSEHID